MAAISPFDPDQELPDRMAEGYEPNFDIDRRVGSQGELFVANLIRSLEAGSIEVKTDMKAGKTGRVYIEMSCRNKPSGIRTTTSEFWAFVLPGDFCIIARTADIRVLAENALLQGQVARCMRGSHPTVGAVFPLYRLISLLRDPGAERAS